jgi:translation initiation factor IF-3
VTFKEVRLSPKIGVGDFETKVHRAVEFLSDGDRIKVTVRFRGRELTHPELGRRMLDRFADQVKDHGVVERAPVLEGKSMFITLASTHKPKIETAPGRPALTPEDSSAPAGSPAPTAEPKPEPSPAPVPAAATTNERPTPAPAAAATATATAPATEAPAPGGQA